LQIPQKVDPTYQIDKRTTERKCRQPFTEMQ